MVPFHCYLFTYPPTYVLTCPPCFLTLVTFKLACSTRSVMTSMPSCRLAMDFWMVSSFRCRGDNYVTSQAP